MRRSAILYAAVAAVVLPAAAHATFIAGDSYLLGSNYSAGDYTSLASLRNSDPTQVVPGFQTGPYSGGTGTSNFIANSAGLNSTPLNASSTTSGAAKWLGYTADNNTRSVARNLSETGAAGAATAPDSSVYYESYLVNCGTFSSTTLATRSILTGFGNAIIPTQGAVTGVPTGLFVGFAQDGTSTYNDNAGNLVIRYYTGNGTDADAVVLNGSTANGNTKAVDNATYLVVAEIDVPTSGTADTVNWWLNPTVLTSDATMTANSSANGSFTGQVVSTTAPGSSFARLNYISQGWLYPAYFDEPRLSTDLASLVTGPVIVSTPSNLTWTGANDGSTWDTATPNFNNASGTAVAFNSGLHDNVTFNDANNGNYNVILYGSLSPGSTTINNSSGAYSFNGNGTIVGTGPLNKLGTSSLTLNVSNSYTGGTNVSGGSLILAVSGALPAGGSVNISGGSIVASGLGSSTTLNVSTLSISGTGSFDLQNTGLDVTSSSISAVTAFLKNGFNGGQWNGSAGIVSSTAAGNAAHLTALGVIVNDNGSGTPLYGTSGTIAGTFDGSTPADKDVLVKYTYYGDANLDGKVDASDYSRIDAAYVADKTTPGSVTGWYNGDFNYDGVVNGSDYTLIDNAFNTQGSSLASEIASPLASSTSEIAVTSAVPEPASLGYVVLSVAGLLGRRKQRN